MHIVVPPPSQSWYSLSWYSTSSGGGGAWPHGLSMQLDRQKKPLKRFVLSRSFSVETDFATRRAGILLKKMPVSMTCTSRNSWTRFCRPKVAINTLVAVGVGYYVLALVGGHYKYINSQNSNQINQQQVIYILVWNSFKWWSEIWLDGYCVIWL